MEFGTWPGGCWLQTLHTCVHFSTFGGPCTLSCRKDWRWEIRCVLGHRSTGPLFPPYAPILNWNTETRPSCALCRKYKNALRALYLLHWVDLVDFDDAQQFYNWHETLKFSNKNLKGSWWGSWEKNKASFMWIPSYSRPVILIFTTIWHEMYQYTKDNLRNQPLCMISYTEVETALRVQRVWLLE